MRIVVDTSVFVSASLMPASTSHRAYEVAVALGELIVSEPVLTELEGVLRREKFAKYLSAAVREKFLATLVRIAIPVSVTSVITECRDPENDKFLALAIDGAATYLITGDDDLLALNPFRGVTILTPREFLTIHDAPTRD
jgi:putative PIN family toxin of toxin-antitoxin system